MLTLIDFTFDVLDGCIHNCQGCNVIKTDGRDIDQKQFDTLLSFFKKLKQKKENGSFDIMVIGPTDFTISDNTEKIFKMAYPLMDMFNIIQLSCTMTYKSEALRERLMIFKPYLNKRKLRLTVPMHSRNVLNKKWHDLVYENIKVFCDVLDEVDIEALTYQVNLVEYTDEELNPIFTTAEQGIKEFMHESLRDKLEIDITISDGRGNLSELNQRLKLKHNLERLKHLHETHYDGDTSGGKYTCSLSQVYREIMNPTLTVEVNGERVLFEDIDLIYQKGKMYRPGHYGEELIIFHEDFSLDWASDDIGLIEELDAKILIKQIEQLDEYCSACPFTSECMKNCGILVKNMVKEKECIYPIEKLKKYMIRK